MDCHGGCDKSVVTGLMIQVVAQLVELTDNGVHCQEHGGMETGVQP